LCCLLRKAYSLTALGSTPCASGATMQQSLTALPDPQKHISSLPQQTPYILPEPQEQVASNLAFCASSIFLSKT